MLFYIMKNKPLIIIIIIPIISKGIEKIIIAPTPKAAIGINNGVRATNKTTPNNPKNTFNKTNPTLNDNIIKKKNIHIPNNVDNI